MVDEPVGDAGLAGDVGNARIVEALAGEDADRGVEDRAALVDAVPGHQTPPGIGPGVISTSPARRFRFSSGQL